MKFKNHGKHQLNKHKQNGKHKSTQKDGQKQAPAVWEMSPLDALRVNYVDQA